MERKLLPQRLEAAELVIREAVLAEAEALQQVYEAGAYLEKWIGSGIEPGHMARLITEGDLPPVAGASREYFSLKAVQQKDGNLVGYVELYHGYPKADTLWLAMVFIHPSYQRKGYGKQVINCLQEAACASGYEHLGVGVALKNWPALRFWVKTGFNKVTGVHGDPVLTEDAYGVIGLRKSSSLCH